MSPYEIALWVLLGIATTCAGGLVALDIHAWWKARKTKAKPTAPLPLLTPAEFRGLEAAVNKLEWSVTQRGQNPKNHTDCQNAKVGLEVLRKNIAGVGPTYTDQQTNYGSY